MRYQDNVLHPTRINISRDVDITEMKCEQYGYNKNLDEYLVKYTVKKGDTLLSIAKSQLSDSSRMNEIRHLNQTFFQADSVQNPILEPGWVLKLPSSIIKHSSGFIQFFSGEVSERYADSLVLRFFSTHYPPNQLVKGVTVHLQPDTITDGTIAVGDCVNVLADQPPTQLGATAIVVKHQK